MLSKWCLVPVFILWCSLGAADGFHRVTQLPGLSRMPSFAMTTGFLNVSREYKYFYWLNECTNKSSSVLVFWFNGGPGCSSLYGLFEENGPFRLHSGRRNAKSKFNSLHLRKNKFSWNRFAHVVYIESPMGVGYSQDELPPYALDHNNTARWNLNAMENFMKAHPEFANHSVYLTGESFAAVYLTKLADLALQAPTSSSATIAANIKGVIVGNGLFHTRLIQRTQVEYVYHHGFIGKDLRNQLNELNCFESPPQLRGVKCQEMVQLFYNQLFTLGINPYNFLERCEESDSYADLARRQGNFLHGRSCMHEGRLESYLSQADVQRAIGIPGPVREWKSCRHSVTQHYPDTWVDMSMEMKSILSQNIKVLLLYGDLDLVCNFEGGEEFVDSLGLKVTQQRRVWVSKQKNSMPQVGGLMKKMGNLTFATVLRSGHMIPRDRPAEAYQIVRRFIKSISESN